MKEVFLPKYKETIIKARKRSIEWGKQIKNFIKHPAKNIM